MLPLKAICKNNKKRKDGTSIVFIQYCFNTDKRTLLDSGVSIPPEFWNTKKEIVSKSIPEIFGKAEELNEKINSKLRLVEDIIIAAKKNDLIPETDLVKHYYNSESIPNFNAATVKKKKAENFFEQIDVFIESRKGKVVEKSNNSFSSMKLRLQAFEVYRKHEIKFSEIDQLFYDDLISFLTFEYILPRKKYKSRKGLRQSTIGKTLKNLKTFLINRMKRKIISNVELGSYKIPNEQTDAIYLNENEIKKIYELDLSENSELILSRNLFVLGCYTGMRFSDYSHIQESDIRDGMIYKMQEKPEHRVVVPLRKIAKEILINKFNSNIPKTCLTIFNSEIKVIAKLAGLNEPIKHYYKINNLMVEDVRPKYAWVSSHTCRRSFCTNEFLAGTPVDLIMKISGHKSIRDFNLYIKIKELEAGLLIQKIWEERAQM